ncbi:MAG: SppA protein [Bacteroidetes bacterium]|nr:SppA protein [Bacteroidota bacterium]
MAEINTGMSPTQAADSVASLRDADIALYHGRLRRFEDLSVISQCTNRNKRENVLVILVTEGGDANSAYRIARCFQMQYKKFSLYIPGLCKSAGTLVAIGAHELIMSDYGELGPLDVQMPKQDSVWEMQSGLTVMSTLSTLQHRATRTFEDFLGNLVRGSSSITLRTAAEIATKMTTGLFSPLYSQVDPLHIGEVGRAMSVASHYGSRLLEKGQNITEENLRKIISEYPSHGYVIDRTEAERLFSSVEEPSNEEVILAKSLGNLALIPWPPDLGFQFLSTELAQGQQKLSQEVKQ